MPDIHPSSVIEDGAQIADDVTIGPFCHVSPHVTIGARCKLMSHVVVTGHTTLGEGNVLWPQVVLGGDPQDVGYKGEPNTLIVGDDNIFRENVTAHIGTTKGGGITRIGDKNYLMAGAHIAHDCQVGSRILMANNVMLAGHVHVHDAVVIAGGTGVHHFTTVGTCAFLAGISVVTMDVPPYTIADGSPAKIRLINKVGLRRNGFTDEQVARLEAAFRKIRRRRNTDSLSFEDRLAAVEAEYPNDEPVANLVDGFRKSMQGRHGRYLESFR